MQVLRLLSSELLFKVACGVVWPVLPGQGHFCADIKAAVHVSRLGEQLACSSEGACVTVCFVVDCFEVFNNGTVLCCFCVYADLPTAADAAALDPAHPKYSSELQLEQMRLQQLLQQQVLQQQLWQQQLLQQQQMALQLWTQLQEQPAEQLNVYERLLQQGMQQGVQHLPQQGQQQLQQALEAGLQLQQLSPQHLQLLQLLRQARQMQQQQLLIQQQQGQQQQQQQHGA